MAIPNELSKYLFPVYEELLDYSMESSQEIVVRNATIIIGDSLFWCMGKHAKYDRLKNNSEKLLSYKLHREIDFDIDYIANIAYGNVDSHDHFILYTGKRNVCGKCRERYIRFNTESGTITPFCIHKIRKIILK